MLGFRDESDFPNTVEAWVSRLHPDDVPKVFDLVARYSNDRTGTVAYDVVYRMKNKSGDYGWYRTIGHGERDAEGRVVYFGGVIRDLAVEKANEEYEMLAQNLIYQLREVASHLNAVGNEVHSRTDDLKRTASHQVGDVQRIATAMEEMTVTVNENTRLTEQAAKLADDARRDATSGGAIVSQTIDGMNSIADIVISSAKTVEQLGVTSDQIGAVAQVIEEIADQTNLLALNAAIEAARAGEQGRGFAVVADEVRKLAERTQRATREIAKTISSIQGETKTAVEAMTKGTHTVQEGRKLAEQASHALKSIISQSTSVAGLITQLAAASEQQVATINEIAGGVDSLSGAAESTAGATGEIAHKTNELAEIASTVQRLLDEIDVNSRDTDVRRQRRLR
jgi:methyl-accepting chemotaxis protein